MNYKLTISDKIDFLNDLDFALEKLYDSEPLCCDNIKNNANKLLLLYGALEVEYYKLREYKNKYNQIVDFEAKYNELYDYIKRNVEAGEDVLIAFEKHQIDMNHVPF